MERNNAWLKYPKGQQRNKVMEYAKSYRSFISECKTERECVAYFIKEAKKQGYRDLKEIIKEKKPVMPGDKIFCDQFGKAIAFFIVGTEPMEEGLNILGAHIDSPRMDLKQNPLYEDTQMAFLDTHYYGGIKKYQWVTIPLAMHGVVAKKDGTIVQLAIGEKPQDPVFGVSDLLIHLSSRQMEKKASLVVEGENLDVLVGSIPQEDKKKSKTKGEEQPALLKEGVKKLVLDILEKEYGFGEEDFLSAEIEIVPAGPARDYGLDSSMIMGYGQDDRVCAFPSFCAMMEAKPGKRNMACLLVDKEEIGSVGATGMQSKFFENAIAEILCLQNVDSNVALRRTLSNSRAISSDVSAAFDPLYSSVSEKKNVAYFGRGLVFNKYTGSRGKSGSNDASAEYMGMIRNVLDAHDVSFQTAELGKVDAGGGGTIAYILGNYGMNVIDGGIAVLNMHAPWEITSKVDIYEAYRGYKVFLEQM